jgi:hypothetical protein
LAEEQLLMFANILVDFVQKQMERSDLILDGLEEEDAIEEMSQRDLKNRLTSPADFVKKLAKIGGFVAGRSEETEDGTQITLGDPGTSDLADALTGASGLQEMAKGDVGVGNTMDALGVAFDAGLPGPPVAPLIAGLGLGDTIPRLARKLKSPKAVGETVESTGELFDEIIQEIDRKGEFVAGGLRETPGLGTVDVETIFSKSDEDVVQDVLHRYPRSEVFPKGLTISAQRRLGNPKQGRILGVFDETRLTGEALENTVGARKIKKALDAVVPDLPGVEKVHFQRVGGAAQHGTRKQVGRGDSPADFDAELVRTAEDTDPVDPFEAGLRQLNAQEAGLRQAEMEAYGDHLEPFETYRGNVRRTQNEQDLAAIEDRLGISNAPPDQLDAMDVSEATNLNDPEFFAEQQRGRVIVEEAIQHLENERPFNAAFPGRVPGNAAAFRELDITRRSDRALEETSPILDLLFSAINRAGELRAGGKAPSLTGGGMQSALDEIGVGLLTEFLTQRR